MLGPRLVAIAGTGRPLRRRSSPAAIRATGREGTPRPPRRRQCRRPATSATNRGRPAAERRTRSSARAAAGTGSPEARTRTPRSDSLARAGTGRASAPVCSWRRGQRRPRSMLRARSCRESDRGFESALQEIRSGGKRGHWIWYVFPRRRQCRRPATSATNRGRELRKDVPDSSARACRRTGIPKRGLEPRGGLLRATTL